MVPMVCNAGIQAFSFRVLPNAGLVKILSIGIFLSKRCGFWILSKLGRNQRRRISLIANNAKVPGRLVGERKDILLAILPPRESNQFFYFKASRTVHSIINLRKQKLTIVTISGMPKLISDERLQDSFEVLLTMQNANGGFAGYELILAGPWLESLNAAEVFGRIMAEYPYPECSTATIMGLQQFIKTYPNHPRKTKIENVVRRISARGD